MLFVHFLLGIFGAIDRYIDPLGIPKIRDVLDSGAFESFYRRPNGTRNTKHLNTVQIRRPFHPFYAWIFFGIFSPSNVRRTALNGTAAADITSCYITPAVGRPCPFSAFTRDGLRRARPSSGTGLPTVTQRFPSPPSAFVSSRLFRINLFIWFFFFVIFLVWGAREKENTVGKTVASEKIPEPSVLGVRNAFRVFGSSVFSAEHPREFVPEFGAISSTPSVLRSAKRRFFFFF